MLIAGLVALALMARTDSVQVAVTPGTVLATSRGAQRILNFDFLLTNPTADTLTLAEIELVVRDTAGHFVLRRFVRASALETVQPARVLLPNGSGAVFNPFQTFDLDVSLGRLEYVFHFSRSGSRDSVFGSARVSPSTRLPRTVGRLPLAGRVLVDDGHDFYSHHRRLDLLAGFVRAAGVTRNFERYALDLLPVDSAGLRFRGEGKRLEDWYAYGMPLLAPAAGRVVAVHRDQPDNSAPGVQDRFDPAAMATDPLALYGNYVVIEYAPGEYGMLGHMQPGSATVAPGDRVQAGQVIGRAGSSGTSLYPHVHYELRTDPTLDADGLPAYFSSVRRIRGTSSRVESAWFADTGDVLESLAR